MNIDAEILLWINARHCFWADEVMWYISKSATWIPLYLVMAALLWRRFGWRRMLVMVVAIATAVGVADWVSSGLIKPLVARLRPTHEPLLEGMIHTVRGYTGGLYGFVSSHAANTSACALLFSLFYRNWRMSAVMVVYVLLNCYSRMYLGVHYPGDILGGWVVGCLIGGLIYVLVRPHMDRTEALLRR